MFAAITKTSIEQQNGYSLCSKKKSPVAFAMKKILEKNSRKK